MSKIYTFREITEKEELEEFFKMRYEIYSQSTIKALLKCENEHYLDIDYYDIHSRHYCLMNDENKAGYLRVVLPKEELPKEEIIEIGEKYSLLNREEYFHENCIAPFPFLSYKGVPQSHWEYYNNLKEKNESLIEASRLIVLPEYHSQKVARHLVECAIVLHVLVYAKQKCAIINCLTEHSPFYQRYGFIPVANGESYWLNGMTRMCLALPLSLSSVSNQYHEKFKSMADEFETNGKIIKEL